MSGVCKTHKIICKIFDISEMPELIQPSNELRAGLHEVDVNNKILINKVNIIPGIKVLRIISLY